MTTPIAFGRSVYVHALTMRVVAYREDGIERFKIPQAADVPFGFATRAEAWPGEPVMLDWDLPKGPRFVLEPTLNGRAVVRYRRLALGQPVNGIVIGSCWRHEGVIDETTLAGPKRTVNLYEVALQPPHRSTKSLVVFVHPNDLDVVEHARATAAKRAPARRMGGTRA